MDILSQFTPYVGLAVVLYAIRQTERVSNRFIPTIAIILGIAFSFWENGFSPDSAVTGLKYALLGIGTVAGIKYFIEKREDQSKK
ncbi:phage holin family protein [Halobacillus litoralis]|uniref:phage holin family protein n=1 Tax=Halobacillus litoralis TaxID=45668 RepID=UPI001CFD0779|nr:phage holin family protein [Halobacillus litoralis]